MSTEVVRPPSTGAARNSLLSVRLYVAGDAPNSLRAVANIEDICTEIAGLRFQLEIVDVLKEPVRALSDGVLITPTLLRLSPEPALKIIGDLSEKKKVSELLRPRRFR